MIYVQTNNQSNIQAVEFDVNKERITGEPIWITRGDRQIIRPELSADGKQFVMRVPRRTQDDIVILSRDGTNPRYLTNDKFFDRYPRWSPDGKKVAFVSDRSGVYEIWMIDADGTNPTQVTFGRQQGSQQGTSFPLFSPDGSQLLFRTNKLSYLLDLSRDLKEQIPQPLPSQEKEGDYFVAWDWSPDGKKLAGTFNGNSGLWLGYFSFETKRYEKVANYDGQPMWLPDSNRFIFSNEGKALIANILTKKVRELPSHQPEQIRSIAVSHDGHLLYYTLSSSESDIWLLDLE
jgi:TolB protein